MISLTSSKWEAEVKTAFGCMVVWISVSILAACTKEKSRTREPLDASNVSASSSSRADESAGEQSVNVQQNPAKISSGLPAPQSDPCTALPKLPPDQLVYLPTQGVVLTRLLKTCVTYEGQSGIEKDTPWLAMGFPCTAGSGRVDIKGNVNAPKMVTFAISTDCPMTANSKEAIKKAFVESIGLPDTTKLIAINPFAVHFWEIPGMPDADTGFTVELRSASAIEGAWKRIRDKEKLRIRLFGRENAWVRGDHFYLVEADLRLLGSSQFGLEIISVKALGKDELEAVKSRCHALRTARNCAEIF